MARVHLRILGPIEVEVDGAEARLTPLTIRLLLRLVVADGDAVPSARLYTDVWGLPAAPVNQDQRSRNEVQKRMLELRRAFDPGGTGVAAQIVRTEQTVSARGPGSAYRLVLDRDELDASEFSDLVNRAAHLAPASAAALLTRAVGLWRGRPAAGLEDAEFAAGLIRRLTATHELANHELAQLHAALGRPDLALPFAAWLAEHRPDDTEAHRVVTGLRAQLRARHGDDVLRHDFPALRTGLVVRRGDLFDQDDASLVIGFCDTFDTSTDEDMLISKESVQGQFLDRIYLGDRAALDRSLRNGLRSVAPIQREEIRDKGRGKRIRYPVGTVVTLTQAGRRFFAVAYSRLGNDLVSRSSASELRLSLDNLWAAVAARGQLRPVAMPLAGSGLARITELSREQLMIMIIGSFLQGCREQVTVTSELRICIPPGELEKIQLSEIEAFLESLDQQGT